MPGLVKSYRHRWTLVSGAKLEHCLEVVVVVLAVVPSFPPLWTHAQGSRQEPCKSPGKEPMRGRKYHASDVIVGPRNAGSLPVPSHTPKVTNPLSKALPSNPSTIYLSYQPDSQLLDPRLLFWQSLHSSANSASLSHILKRPTVMPFLLLDDACAMLYVGVDLDIRKGRLPTGIAWQTSSPLAPIRHMPVHTSHRQHAYYIHMSERDRHGVGQTRWSGGDGDDGINTKSQSSPSVSVSIVLLIGKKSPQAPVFETGWRFCKNASILGKKTRGASS